MAAKNARLKRKCGHHQNFATHQEAMMAMMTFARRTKRATKMTVFPCKLGKHFHYGHPNRSARF